MPSLRHTDLSHGVYWRVSDRDDTMECPTEDAEDNLSQEADDFPPEDTTATESHTTPLELPLLDSSYPIRLHVYFSRAKDFWSPISDAFENVFKFILSNPIVSVFQLLVVIAVSLGIGLQELLDKERPVVIDKSIDAFSIPSHIVTKRHDAFKKAISNMQSAKRGKRDLQQVESQEHFLDLNQDILQHSRKKRWTSQGQGSDTYFDEDFVNFFNVDNKQGKTVVREKRSVVRQKVRNSIKKLAQDEEPRSLFGTILHRVRRALRSQYLRRWKIQIVYLARGDDDHNIFTEERLETIHKIEKAIMNHKEFQKFCYKNYAKIEVDPNLKFIGGCAPLNSLLTYFYPSKTKDGMIHYDGLGNNLDDINRTLSFAMTRDTFYWYVDEHISNTNRKSRLLRSEVHFGAPLPNYPKWYYKKKEQEQKYIEFVTSYIQFLSKASTDKVNVLYGGNEIFDYEVGTTFWNDLKLSFIAIAFILLFMFILTSFSFWLMFWGLVSILLSLPLAFCFYHSPKAFGVQHLGILNGAAAFLIVGIGVDDVFVFMNTFRQANHMKDISDRMLHTVKTAGIATFFTSLTTAAAFAANVASAIPAVHDFGLFMSLIVSGCWISVFLIMPPAINLWFRYFACCESYLYGRVGCLFDQCSGSFWEIPSDIAHFLDSKKAVSSTSAPSDSSSDSDVQLLQMDAVEGNEGGWPIYLGMLNQILYEDDDPLLQLENELDDALQLDQQQTKVEGCHMTNKLQILVYHLVAKPVIRFRWFILGVFLVLLVMSGALMSQLRPATKPPQLFRSTTNLQQVLDLKANFSDSGINCNECSGFYNEVPVRVEVPTDPPVLPPIKPRTTPGTGPKTSASTKKPVVKTTTTSTTASTQPPVKPSKPVKPPHTKPPVIPPVKTEKPWQPQTKNPPLTKSTTTVKIPTRVTIIPPFIPEQKTTKRKTTPHQPLTKPPPPPLTQPPPQTPPPAVKTEAPKTTVTMTTPSSADKGYDPCAGGKCDKPKKRPPLETGAAVYVVFGIKGIDRSNVSREHVVTEKGTVVYDDKFHQHFQFNNFDAGALVDLCRICKLIANNTKLVKPNSSQCLPYNSEAGTGIIKIKSYLHNYKECRNLPENKIVNKQKLKVRALLAADAVGMRWVAFAFESTTYKGQGYFAAYSEYQRWENFLEHLKQHVLHADSPLQSMYQTSDFWNKVMMEVVAVSSAIYGLVLSLIICVAAVLLFTGHVILLVIVVGTILGVICLVVALFFVAGWEMGAVEAVSLSILVGSSVDYCVHLVEGYLLAGRNPPVHVMQSNKKLRKWRTLAATSHIGVSIVSSAVTTIVAAIPLTQTVIQPFSKFGQIVAINTTISIFYTLTACAAFLSIFGPARFTYSLRSFFLAIIGNICWIGILILILFIISKCGIDIPSPGGNNLFSS